MSLEVKETAVDCGKCHVRYKCCTYRPFIANFKVGRMIQKGRLEQEFIKDWDWLPVGLSPSLQYRQRFRKWGTEKFGEEESLLCSLYNRASGQCRVWEDRPGVCRSFFCKSSYGVEGLEYWGSVEEYWWAQEWKKAHWLSQELGWTSEELQRFGEYLQKDHLQSPKPLPKEYVFSQWEKASEFYLKCASLEESSPDFEDPSQKEDLLAQKQKLL